MAELEAEIDSYSTMHGGHPPQVGG